MKKILFVCFAAFALAACSEKNVSLDNTKAEKAGFPYTITATIAENAPVADSRASFTDPTPANPATATWSVVWNVGDEIRVFNGVGKDSTVVYVVKSVTAGTATFELKAGEDVSLFRPGCSTFFAATGGTAATGVAYSYLNGYNTNGEGGIDVGLASQKSILPGSIDNDFFIAVSKAELSAGELNFHFLPVVSYIRITIPDGMSYNPGQLYFQSTLSGGTANPSGFYRVRMNLSDNTIKEIGKRNKGGSSNVPIYYGSGTATPSTPYNTMIAGVYYCPVIPGSTVKRLLIKDTEGTTKCTRNFTSPELVAGKIYDFGAIPTAAD